MTDAELDEAIAEEYGHDWNFGTVDMRDPLVVEFLRRLAADI